MFEVLYDHELLFYLTLVSIIGFVGSVIFIPWILIKLPEDYFFAQKRKPCPWGKCPKIIRHLVIILKNILGLLLIIGGIIMLITPGQGLLTILVGIIFTDFPHKYAILRKIIKHPKILSSINKLRKKAKKAPLQV